VKKKKKKKKKKKISLSLSVFLLLPLLEFVFLKRHQKTTHQKRFLEKLCSPRERNLNLNSKNYSLSFSSLFTRGAHTYVIKDT